MLELFAIAVLCACVGGTERRDRRVKAKLAQLSETRTQPL